MPQFTSEKVTVIGHSMGGATSLRFASECPNMVERLIMVDTAGGVASLSICSAYDTNA
jgi:pimeloyl-ACP methyl ester carboxylesterase